LFEVAQDYLCLKIWDIVSAIVKKRIYAQASDSRLKRKVHSLSLL